MNEMLSQQEIDALLRNMGSHTIPVTSLTPEEKDALGEIGNISMGTAATTLSRLLNQKVIISIPNVSTIALKELVEDYRESCVGIQILYTEGLKGSNLLILKEQDVKMIMDLLMGGDGTNIEVDLNDLHLSAISEVMNQMVGSSATSLASMIHKNIEISPPKAFIWDMTKLGLIDDLEMDEYVIKILFKFEIGNILNSEMIQLLQVPFAKELVQSLLKQMEAVPQISDDPPVRKAYTSAKSDKNPVQKATCSNDPTMVNVQQVSFQSFDQVDVNTSYSKDNIDLIMDVPLQVTVEVGKARKLVREILSLGNGSIVELDKVAGDPVDILVNGKLIAKGEIVVIDENFGVRIIDIINPVNRIQNMR